MNELVMHPRSYLLGLVIEVGAALLIALAWGAFS